MIQSAIADCDNDERMRMSIGILISIMYVCKLKIH